MSSQATCEASPNAISSPGLASGHTHFGKPDGQMIDLFGPVPVLANLSARQAKALRLLTSGTYGQPSTTSSKSASLQRSLESKLRAKTQTLGSTLYKLTWKPWVTPSGLSRSRLRASVRRTSETDFIGWPMPTTRDWKGATENTLTRKDGRKRHDILDHAALLAGWPTPQARDHFPAHSQTYIAEKKAQGHGMANLNDLVTLTGPARLTASGEMLTGSTAGMESGGQLRPEFSRWLMGIPSEWDRCAPISKPKQRKS